MFTYRRSILLSDHLYLLWLPDADKASLCWSYSRYLNRPPSRWYLPLLPIKGDENRDADGGSPHKPILVTRFEDSEMGRDKEGSVDNLWINQSKPLASISLMLDTYEISQEFFGAMPLFWKREKQVESKDPEGPLKMPKSILWTRIANLHKTRGGNESNLICIFIQFYGKLGCWKNLVGKKCNQF